MLQGISYIGIASRDQNIIGERRVLIESERNLEVPALSTSLSLRFFLAVLAVPFLGVAIALTLMAVDIDAFWARSLTCVTLTSIYATVAGIWILRPIHTFARAAEHLPNSPLKRFPGRTPKELQPAARALLKMRLHLHTLAEERQTLDAPILQGLRHSVERLKVKALELPEAVRKGVLFDVHHIERVLESGVQFYAIGGASPTVEAVNLLSLLEQAVEQAVLAGGDAVITVGHPIFIQANADAIGRAVTNLLENALRYGRTARLRLVEVPIAESDDMDTEALIQISDDGPGLPQRELERVFEPYYRTETARQVNDRGVGLGLAIARSLVRAQGGEVSLKSDAGGLTASIRLPITR